MIEQIKIALSWLGCQPVYLDTETTGLDEGAEIVQIAVVDDAGRILLDRLVRPTCAIPNSASAIHGITNAMVADAPTWAELWPRVCSVTRNRMVVIYNSAFDMRLMRQTCQYNRIAFDLPAEAVVCAMLLYADYRGDYDDWHGNNRWHKLDAACVIERVPTAGVMPHQAAGDAELTRRLVHAMASMEYVGRANVTHRSVWDKREEV